MNSINLPLIHNLCASNATQATEDILIVVRELALKYGWSFDEAKEVADMVVCQRHAAEQTALEMATVCLADLLGEKR